MFWKTDGAFILPHPHFNPGQDAEGPTGWQPLPLVAIETQQRSDVQRPADEMDFAYADEFVRALDDRQQHSHPCSGEEGRHVMEVGVPPCRNSCNSLPLDRISNRDASMTSSG